MNVLIRWSVWGKQNAFFYEMLANSIASFRHFFASKARYVVFTDNAAIAHSYLGKLADINGFTNYSDCSSLDFLEEQGTWRKWSPQIRISDDITELRIDADMFLLRAPIELYDFCFDNRKRWEYVVTLEEWDELWPYGNFAHLCQGVPHINAGLVGQSPGADLSELLNQQFAWWLKTIPISDRLYHDEQGAVMAALIPSLRKETTLCLPASRYRVVCPLNANATSSIEDVVLLHATYPEHPAFIWFQDTIRKLTADILAKYAPKSQRLRP